MVEMNFNILEISPKITEIHLEMKVSDELLFKKLELMNQLKSALKADILDLRAGYQNISIHWKSAGDLEKLQRILSTPKSSKLRKYQTWEVPVCYSSSFSRDLQAMAESKEMSTKEIISLHSKPLYRIHFYGFLPGFMYLAGLDPTLSFPRKSKPDRAVQKGSVAIGGNQTGIYPNESPGGWHVIGKTPITLFDPHSPQPVWAKAGDYIQFKPISLDEYEKLESQPLVPDSQ